MLRADIYTYDQCIYVEKHISIQFFLVDFGIFLPCCDTDSTPNVIPL